MPTNETDADSCYYGSCLCGAVELAVRGGISSIICCHCSRCRKSSGSAFATNGFVRADGLAILKGAETVHAFASAPGRLKHFCGLCGSPLYSSNAADPSRYRLRLGILDSQISERPVSHNFVSSAASWDSLDACLPRSDGYEPGRA